MAGSSELNALRADEMDEHLRGVAGPPELNALRAGTSREVAGEDDEVVATEVVGAECAEGRRRRINVCEEWLVPTTRTVRRKTHREQITPCECDAEFGRCSCCDLLISLIRFVCVVWFARFVC